MNKQTNKQTDENTIILSWILTNEYKKEFERFLFCKNIQFGEKGISITCDGYKTTRDYKFLIEHKAQISDLNPYSIGEKK